MKIAGWIMTGLLALFMLGASAYPKLSGMAVASDIMVTLGWSPDYLLMIGVIEVVCVLLFIYPPTAMLGAILFTALLGGAIGANLRADSPLFSHTLFGVYLGLWTWAALWLRSPTFRTLFPLSR